MADLLEEAEVRAREAAERETEGIKATILSRCGASQCLEKSIGWTQLGYGSFNGRGVSHRLLSFRVCAKHADYLKGL